MRVVAALVVAVGTWAAPASAQHLTGGDFADRCRPDANNSWANYCLGFMHSFFDTYTMGLGMSLGRAELTTFDVGYCIPADESVGQVRDSIVGFIDRNPSYRQERAAWGILNAVVDTYRCD